MKLFGEGAVAQATDAVKAVAKIAKALVLTEEGRRRAEINKRGDKLRAERANASDAATGKRRWIPRRGGWLK
jgi:hypothetical protein